MQCACRREDCLQGLKVAVDALSVGGSGASIKTGRGYERTGTRRQQAMARDASFTSCSGASTYGSQKLAKQLLAPTLATAIR
jgi:hypothetical protein